MSSLNLGWSSFEPFPISPREITEPSLGQQQFLKAIWSNPLPWAGTFSTKNGCSKLCPTWPWIFPSCREQGGHPSASRLDKPKVLKLSSQDIIPSLRRNLKLSSQLWRCSCRNNPTTAWGNWRHRRSEKPGHSSRCWCKLFHGKQPWLSPSSCQRRNKINTICIPIKFHCLWQSAPHKWHRFQGLQNPRPFL